MTAAVRAPVRPAAEAKWLSARYRPSERRARQRGVARPAAAFWLASGHDGTALVDLAGPHGDDPHEVRDLLPAALADYGAVAPTADAAARRWPSPFAKHASPSFASRPATSGARDAYRTAGVFASGNVACESDEPLGAHDPVDPLGQ